MKYVKLFEDWIDSVEDDPELMELEQEEYDEYYDEDMEDDERKTVNHNFMLKDFRTRVCLRIRGRYTILL